MDENKLKTAFFKIKEDISNIQSELFLLKNEFIQLKSFLTSPKQGEIPLSKGSTDNSYNSADNASTTDNPTVPQEIGGLKYPNLSISTGNEGVPTDRQTDQQTDNPAGFYDEISKNNAQTSIETNIQAASNILHSLDRLKKEIRLKFKRVTNQEMSVFSTIYQLEEQDPINATYKEIARRLSLSQSSIRDYVQRMIHKGIPIKKQKINNKKLILSISSDLKKIASLSTIVQLRDL